MDTDLKLKHPLWNLLQQPQGLFIKQMGANFKMKLAGDIIGQDKRKQLIGPGRLCSNSSKSAWIRSIENDRTRSSSELIQKLQE